MIMIRLFATSALCLGLLAIPQAAAAHGGGLNAEGCHNDRKRGTYHCHRGASAARPAPRPATRPAARPVSRPAPLPAPRPAARPVTAAPVALASTTATVAGRPPLKGKPVILDGDTIQIGLQRIRLQGIDAFEAEQICEGDRGAYRCGGMATAALRELIGDEDVICTDLGKDAYGRMLGICRAGATDLNAQLVRMGWAFAFTRYSQDYIHDQAEAQAGDSGAWKGKFAFPWDYRAGGQPTIAGAQRINPSNAECPIKGNIRTDGTRIYHMPTDPSYARTKAEAMFCDEAEAIAAGFRKAGTRR